jgi:hypothetical protein
LLAFNAYQPTFLGGVRIGAGDANGDGLADVVTGTGAGFEPLVNVLSGKDATALLSFNVFDPAFQFGLFVDG